jgi:nucleotide-binding universal stress UspA family protein
MFKTIVVGTDGSDTAARAVQLAADLVAASDDAVLHIVSVAKPVSQTVVALADSGPAPSGLARAELDADTTSALNELLGRAAESVADKAPRVEIYPRTGSPAEVLCELADQVRADLLVVGNRGMRGGRRFLGSVPNSVSHHAPCSVLIADTG